MTGIQTSNIGYSSLDITCSAAGTAKQKKTRKRAIAKALHLEGRTTSRQTFWVFLFFLFENIVFGRLVYVRMATAIRRHVAVETPTDQVKSKINPQISQ